MNKYRVAELRKKRCWTQEVLAEKANITVRTIQRIENGTDVSLDTLTIRLVADFEILWNRRKKRDLEKSRHLSHIMTHYHNGDRLDDRAVADNHITKK